ncbi:MAG: hypothetical protein Q8O89_06305, partial [Nanoarchaeota archaeon]|nr:hypothetical protein [Nanoarchaeota archaeon]
MAQTNEITFFSCVCPAKPFWMTVIFVMYLIIAAIIPYGLRCLHYYLYQQEVPIFYKNEWDLFVFCIAIAIAILAEYKST